MENGLQGVNSGSCDNHADGELMRACIGTGTIGTGEGTELRNTKEKKVSRIS